MSLISRLNPLPGFKDLWSEFAKPQPYRIPILLVSMFGTFCLLYSFTQVRVVGPPVQPDVTYISTFAPDRSDEEIIAGNIENQKRQDAKEAELAERIERRKEIYRTIGRATGLDVDEMERKIIEDEAREKADKDREEGKVGQQRTSQTEQPVENTENQ